MSDWRIQQRYGYGAGLVPLNPDPVSRAQPEATFFGGMRALADEFHGQGLSGNFRFLVRAVPALGFVVALVFALLATISRDQTDQIDLEIVQLEPELLPEPEVIEPEPIPEIVEVEPEPEPEPIEVAKIEPPPAAPPAPKLPPPPPKRIPEPPKPPPPPKRVVEPPKRVPPKPKPPPTRVVRRPPPPKVRIDPVPARPVAKPPVVARVERTEPKPQMPKLAPPPPIAMDPVPPANPVLAAQRAPARNAPRSLTPPPRVAPPSLSPVAALDIPEESRPKPLPSRSVRATPKSAPRKPAAAPKPLSFDLSAPRAAPASQAPTPTRSARAAPSSTPNPARRVMPSSLAPAASLSTGSEPTSAQAEPGSNRTDRVAPSARAGRNQMDDRLEGVALSSLAACRSDGEEEKLKVKVMAVIGSRKECSSEAGRYKFIETKNLNAFLMLIERAPSRRQADRCVELRMTLECLGAR